MATNPNASAYQSGDVSVSRPRITVPSYSPHQGTCSRWWRDTVARLSLAEVHQSKSLLYLELNLDSEALSEFCRIRRARRAEGKVVELSAMVDAMVTCYDPGSLEDGDVVSGERGPRTSCFSPDVHCPWHPQVGLFAIHARGGTEARVSASHP